MQITVTFDSLAEFQASGILGAAPIEAETTAGKSRKARSAAPAAEPAPSGTASASPAPSSSADSPAAGSATVAAGTPIVSTSVADAGNVATSAPAAAATTPSTSPSPVSGSATAAAALDYDRDVMPLLQRIAAERAIDQVSALMARCGVAKSSELKAKPNLWPRAIETANECLAGADLNASSPLA